MVTVIYGGYSIEIPNAFEDAIWDFRVGTKFYIPKKETIDTALGI